MPRINFFGECEIQDVKKKIAPEDALRPGEKYTEIKFNCKGEKVTVAIGRRGGIAFVDVEKGGTIISKSGERAIRYLMGKE